jgi:MFS family permease
VSARFRPLGDEHVPEKEPGTSTQHGRPLSSTSGAWLLLAVAIIAGLGWAIVALPYPPLQDFNETAYQAFLARLAVIGELPNALCVEQKPVPNVSATFAMSVLMFLFSPIQASRVFLIIYIAAAAAIAIQIARRKHTSDHWQATALVIFAVVFVGSAFWNGYVNYLVGLLLMGVYLCLSDERQASAGWIVTFTVSAFFCHALVFLPLCILAALHLATRRRWLALVLSMAPAALLVLLYRMLPGHVEQYSEPPFGFVKMMAYKAYTIFKAGPYHDFLFADGNNYTRAQWLYYLGVFADVAFGAALVVALALGLRAALKRSSITVHTLTFITLIGIFLVLPNMALAVVNPGERFWYSAVLIGLATLPTPPRLMVALASASALVIITLPQLSDRDYDTQVAGSALQAQKEVLFSHRPTAFANKVDAMRRAALSGQTPVQPIDFQTGLFFLPDPVVGCGRN